MISKEQYLSNPCKASSLPFWKTNSFEIPDNVSVTLIEDDSLDVEGERFFKLIHNLENINKPILSNQFEVVEVNLPELLNHINSCYQEEGMTLEELESYQEHPTYDPDLWVVVKDKNTHEIVASGIAEVDLGIKEGVLEWIQVSKKFRRQGLGSFVVNELLTRLKDKANFVTVSGKVNNPTHPLDLYHSLGFKGDAFWCVSIKTF